MTQIDDASQDAASPTADPESHSQPGPAPDPAPGAALEPSRWVTPERGLTPAADGAIPPLPAWARPTASWVEPAVEPPAPAIVGSPPPARPGAPSTFRTALLAAALSSVLTLTGSALIFRAMLPAGAASASPAASTVATASASPGPSAGGSAASTLASTPLDAAPDATSATVSATAKILPSVVTISTQSPGRRGSTLSGAGSGFIFDSRGWILTNRHVVTGATTVTVGLTDGRSLTAQVYGVSSTNDLAVLRIDATGLPAVTIGDSLRLALGQSIIVVGSPLGEYPGSVATGVVSGLGRAIDITGVEHLSNLIQTDAAVNPGNSGGPMVDLGGRVIGVAVATSQAAGIAFGIPIEDARSIMALALSGQPIP